MITIGADSHKRTHTFVAVDANGRELGHKTVKAVPAGHLEALRWAERWSGRSWALEDCRQLSRRLESDLLRAGERVVRVPPKLMTGARRSAREPGKSDPIDAAAVARAALREPDLPAAALDGPEREVRLLVDHREDLVAERTRMQSRTLWHLHELLPEVVIPAGALSSQRAVRDLAERLEDREGTVAAIVRELLGRIAELTRRINELQRELARLIAPLAPTLLALTGCGVLCAAKIVGETAGVGRFRSRDAFARHNGTAPIPVWSGAERFRLNRGGNRQLNAALHRIAITQMQRPGPGRDYIERRRAAGDTKTEAIRALRRRLSNEVYRRMLADSRSQPNLASAAA